MFFFKTRIELLSVHVQLTCHSEYVWEVSDPMNGSIDTIS